MDVPRKSEKKTEQIRITRWVEQETKSLRCHPKSLSNILFTKIVRKQIDDADENKLSFLCISAGFERSVGENIII